LAVIQNCEHAQEDERDAYKCGFKMYIGYYYKLWELFFRRFNLPRIQLNLTQAEDRLYLEDSDIVSKIKDDFAKIAKFYRLDAVKLYTGSGGDLIITPEALEYYEFLNEYVYIKLNENHVIAIWIDREKFEGNPVIYEDAVFSYNPSAKYIGGYVVKLADGMFMSIKGLI